MCIDHTYLNDGVYQIASVSSTKITLDATLTPEETDDTTFIYGLKVPKTFIDLATEISTYDSGASKGVKSESQGNRSVTYGSGTGDNTWQSVYAVALSPYKKMYCDKKTFFKRYNMDTKGWC